jgi:hypothetical protein
MMQLFAISIDKNNKLETIRNLVFHIKISAEMVKISYWIT